jgi:hypothetical protein
MSVYHFIDRRALETGKTVAIFGLLGIAVFQPVWLTMLHKQRERFVIQNGAGSYTVAPALAFDEATDLHEDCGFQAARAAFSRHPEGADRLGELERWYLDDPNSGGGKSSLGKIKALIAGEAAEFRAKQFHQKMNLTDPVQVVVTSDQAVKVTLSGQLIRTGVFQGRAHLETRKFSLQLILVRNPNMMLNNRPPLAIWDFDYSLL